MKCERGSATTLAAALAFVLLATAMCLAMFGVVLVAGERARAAADFSALAAATDTSNQPCLAAAAVAERNGAALVECVANGTEARVAARVNIPDGNGMLSVLLPDHVVQHAHAGTA